VLVVEQMIKDECSIHTGISLEELESSIEYFAKEDQEVKEAMQV